MPCRHPHVFVSALLVCAICGATLLRHDSTPHAPEHGVYRPGPGSAYSISTNHGGTAIATAIAAPIMLVDRLPEF